MNTDREGDWRNLSEFISIDGWFYKGSFGSGVVAGDATEYNVACKTDLLRG